MRNENKKNHEFDFELKEAVIFILNPAMEKRVDNFS